MTPDSGDNHENVITRRRLGGYIETYSADEGAAGPGAIVDFVPIETAPDATRRSGGKRRKRRHRKRPWYRRPLIMVPLTLFVICLVAAGAVGYRIQSTLTAVHSVSTPPPVVTDQTFIDPDVTDPDEIQGPIVVDTGPASAYLTTQEESGELPAAPKMNFTGRIKSIADTSGDLVQGAAAAVGVNQQKAVPMTILLMGVDAQPGAAIDIGVRPDVLAVLQLDPASNTCRALSIPRDTRVELPGYGKTKINHALMVGGIPYQLRVTEEFLGLEIDHYLLMDFEAFQRIVDSLGGVTVDIPEDLSKNGKLQFEAGTQQFDGEMALKYARFRSEPDGDLGRVERQWDILGGIADKINGKDIVGEVNELLPAVEDHMRTDLKISDITTLAQTYGSKCTSPKAADISMMRGTRVKLFDPILKQALYYNIVEDDDVVDYVRNLGAFVPVNSQGSATPESGQPGGQGTPEDGVKQGTATVDAIPEERRATPHATEPA